MFSVNVPSFTDARAGGGVAKEDWKLKGIKHINKVEIFNLRNLGERESWQLLIYFNYSTRFVCCLIGCWRRTIKPGVIHGNTNQSNRNSNKVILSVHKTSQPPTFSSPPKVYKGHKNLFRCWNESHDARDNVWHWYLSYWDANTRKVISSRSLTWWDGSRSAVWIFEATEKEGKWSEKEIFRVQVGFSL